MIAKIFKMYIINETKYKSLIKIGAAKFQRLDTWIALL